MGKLYGQGILLKQSIEFTERAPIDTRAAVEYYTDLENLLAHEGLITYVKENKTFYRYDGTSWAELIVAASVTGLNIHALLPLVSDLPSDGTLGDAFLVGTSDSNTCYMWDVYKEAYVNIGPLRGETGLGTPGELGLPGKSDYEIAVEHGYNGTEELWINTYFVTALMFPAIRALQAEVARLRNAFLYGINSYTEEDTASSRVVDGYSTIDDNEPLWAIDEDDLALIESLTVLFDETNGLHPAEGTTINCSTLGMLGITSADWIDENDYYKNNSDAKHIIYMATSKDTATLNLKSSSSEDTLDIPLTGLTKALSADSYHYMIVISRQYGLKGSRYVYISIDNNVTNLKLVRGYYNPNTHSLQDEVYLFDTDLYLKSIHFNNLNLTKLNFYTKYQDFSNEIISEAPKELDYKYNAAHITIRGVQNSQTMENVKGHLLSCELVWNEEDLSLYIKNATGNLIKIGSTSSSGGGSSTDTNMTTNEIITILKNNGIIIEEGGTLKLNAVSDITFINDATGESYNVSVDAYGNLVTTKVNTASIKDRLVTGSTALTDKNSRGLIGTIGLAEFINANPGKTATSNIGLYSDRLKIGAFYIPLDTDKVYGCSHCYVELENTSDKDIPLTGFYLHYSYPKLNSDGVSTTQTVAHLALTGTIKAGSTYVIRGAAKPISVNTFINVDSYDQEWYVDGKPLDMTAISSIVSDSAVTTRGYAFALTFFDSSMATGNPSSVINTKDITPSTTLVTGTNYLAGYVDSIGIGSGKWEGEISWLVNNGSAARIAILSNSICKNTFELDPANLAYQALNSKDSSRIRHKSADDFLVVSLANEYIEFPHSDEKYPVSYFAPKGSKENKTVCTDKTLFDTQKPNMVTVAFGIDMMTTRTFNWLSGGLFDEYVWIREKNNSEDSWHRFESYKTINTVDSVSSVPANTETETYIDEDVAQYNKTAMSRVEFHSTHTIKVTADGKTSIYKLEFIDPKHIVNRVYARKTATFPGTDIIYTAHKCIVTIVSSAPEAKTTYEYIVGRADKNGNPNIAHCSEILEFTLYPTSYTPRVYLITDQLGFHWIEYQAWAGAAKAVNARIEADCTASNIIPILINTGDMTQNGTRINEWLDYYNAGKCLFNHLELMNVVGNNDLCNSADLKDSSGNIIKHSYELLGTGDDIGKSNPYYFNICYCYEVDPSNITVNYTDYSNESKSMSIDLTPIVNGVYIPSLYYFGNDTYKYVMVNSELTKAACINLYGLSGVNGAFYNIYTGCVIDTNDGNKASWPISAISWTPIYTQLYGILSKCAGKSTIVACHEMPFTVITANNTAESDSIIKVSRGHDDENGLVGSHLNQIVDTENGTGIYWFSRLLEHFGIKLCIGGHKHTYSSTYPLRENYIFNSVAASTLKMKMLPTLQYDNVTWEASVTYTNSAGTETSKTAHLTKFPLVKTASFGLERPNTNCFLPGILKNDLTNGVVYFMCLATGYKRQSNKELPTAYLVFSQFLPKTNDAGTTPKLKVSANQQWAMFAVITHDSSNYKIELARIKNLFDSSRLFTLYSYGTGELALEYAHPYSGSDNTLKMYGSWGNATSSNYIVTTE